MSNGNRYIPDQFTPAPVGRGRGVLSFTIPFLINSPSADDSDSRPGNARRVCPLREYDAADMQSDVNHKVACTSTHKNYSVPDMLGQMSSIVHQIVQQLQITVIKDENYHAGLLN